MHFPAVRLRVCVHARSDVGAIAQLLGPALGLAPAAVAARLTAGRLSIGPVQRHVAEELAEVLGGFGVSTQVEANAAQPAHAQQLTG